MPSATLCTGITFAAASVCLLAGGAGVLIALPKLIASQADDAVPIKGESSSLYQAWADHGGFGAPTYQYFYIWNCTNADAYVERGEKPKLAKVGPFAYRLYNWKEDIDFTKDKSEVTFRYHNYYVETPERHGPGLSLDAIVTVPNFALQGALLMAKQIGVLPLVKKIFEERMAASCKDPSADTCERLFLRRKIREILWGFNDPILSLIAEVAPQVLPPGVTPFIGIQSVDTPAFYAAKSRQYTGVGNYRNAFIYKEWTGLKNLSQWWPAEARESSGLCGATDGWQFAPPHSVHDPLTVLVDALNLVLDFAYQRHSDYRGVHTHRYLFAKETFQRGSTFGKTHYNNAQCDGMINLTSVRSASVFMSKPYFLDAEPCFADMVELPGKGNYNDHDTFMEVEPVTGNALAAWQRLQVNLLMEPWLCELAGSPGPIPASCNISTAYVPILYLDQQALACQNQVDTLKSAVFGTEKTIQTVAIIAACLSVGVALWAVMLIWQHKQHKKQLSLLHAEDDEACSDADRLHYGKQDAFADHISAKRSIQP